MATGFIYIVKTVKKDYEQKDFSCVPTVLDGRLYFGPCKAPMRPRMQPGDWIFGVSPSGTKPRRIVFGAEIQEVMTFADAYRRFPDLRAPAGPIPVKPSNRLDPSYARAHYEGIPGSSHEDRWEKDLTSAALDRFFVCAAPEGLRNRWWGASGPEVDDEVLALFNRCPVFGESQRGTRLNTGRPTAPIAWRGLTTGLHLETDDPQELLALCGARLAGRSFPAAAQADAPATPRGCGRAVRVSDRGGPSRC
jgi:hypothetical protein